MTAISTRGTQLVSDRVGRLPRSAAANLPTPKELLAKLPPVLVILYLVTMPFLVGLPRGSVLPALRPSEGLQLAVTAGGIAIAGFAVINGQRWLLRIRPVEWWLLTMTAAASVLPLLWLAARQQPVGADELMATFPFIKYAALYLLVRVCIRSEADVAIAAKAFLASALFITGIAVAQALGVGPVVDLLGQFFVSSTEDVVDGGRGTTTIGSSIATGAYLAIATGVALSWGLRSANRTLLATAALLAGGTLASGQAGSVLALGVIVLVVAYRQKRAMQLATWGLPVAALGLVALWPIVTARLADIDQGSGLPESWLIRWNNISELYLPSLLDGGWLLGVNPDAILLPPDVWRESIYLESGYLWLLWVGGVPLLVATLAFLRSAWKALDPIEQRDAGEQERASAMDRTDDLMVSIRIAGQAAVAMIAVLSVLDPHLTLRAGADAFFVVLGLGMAKSALVVPVDSSPLRWRSLLAADLSFADNGGARLQFAEAPPVEGAEMTLNLMVRSNGDVIGSTRLALFRYGPRLRGTVVGDVDGQLVTAKSPEAAGLVWRGLATMSRSLRLEDLHWNDPQGNGGWVSADRKELKLGAYLAEKLEIERIANQHRVTRLSATSQGSSEADDQALPAIRLDFGLQLPLWKRGVDLALGGFVMVATAPFWLASAVLVRRSSPGPILYRQVRIGAGGLPFQIYKFRTMFIDNDDSAQREQNMLELLGEADAAKDTDDPRITGVGRWLRRLSLDELPQLINIMRAEMSLVGPRPSLLWESELFIPQSRRRLRATPGLTGLWQVSGRADVSMSEMLDLDLDYLDRMGPITDLRCLVGTVTSVLAGDGAR